jgi:PAS domain S-box-containing protein
MCEVPPVLSENQELLSSHLFVAMGRMTTHMAILTDASRKIIWVNQAFTEITGYSPKEAIGKKPGQLLQGEESDPAVIQRMRIALSEGKPFREELLNYRKSGESYWVDIQVEPIFSDKGELRGFFGLNQNISQRKRALCDAFDLQQQLEAERSMACQQRDSTRATLEEVIRCSPIPIILVDTDHIITEFNPAAEALLEFSREELVGKKTPAIFHDMDEVLAKARLRGWEGDPVNVRFNDLIHFFQIGQTTSEQRELVSKSGQKFPVLLGLSTLRNTLGETIGFMGVITDLRQQIASEETRNSLLTRLHKVAQHLPGFIYEFKLNPDGTSFFPFASDGIQRIYGFSPNEVIEDASEIWKTIHPSDMMRVRESIRISAETRATWICDYRVVLADGTVRWISGSANPENKDDGSVLWFGYIQDITDRQLASSALKRKSDLLQLLTETALDFINVPVLEADGAIEKALGDVGSFFGIDRVYLFDYDFHNQTTSNTHEWCAEGIESFKDQLQKQPIVGDSEWYSKHKEGEEIYIADVASMPECSVKSILSMQAIRSILAVPLMHQKKPIGFVGFDAVRDNREFSNEEILLLRVFARALVSVRLRVESYYALQDSRGQIEMFFDVSVGLVCICDRKGNFLQVNHGWEIFLGLPKHSISGTSIMSYVHPDDLAYTKEMMTPREGDKIEAFVNRLLNREGVWRSISWVSVSRNGRIFASARDVTTEHEAALALERSLDDAKRIANMRSRLISMASHEFRTPLSSIRLNSEMLQAHVASQFLDHNPKIEKNLSRIIASTDHLSKIITDVLEIEGSLNSKTPIELHPLDPHTVCEDCLQLCQDLHGTTHHLNLTDHKTDLLILADEMLLKSAVNNLLDNAIRYSPSESLIELTLDGDNDQVYVTIEDQGIGIPGTESEHIFEPFFRSSNTGNISGTGLGLPIVLQNVERMNGSISYRKNYPRGSIFVITFPRYFAH